MQINISYLTRLLLVGSVVVAGGAIASDDYIVSIFGWPGYKLPGYDELDSAGEPL